MRLKAVRWLVESTRQSVPRHDARGGRGSTSPNRTERSPHARRGTEVNHRMGAHSLPREPRESRGHRRAHRKPTPGRSRRRAAVVAGFALAGAALIPVFSPATAQEARSAGSGGSGGSSASTADTALVTAASKASASARHRRKPRPRPPAPTVSTSPKVTAGDVAPGPTGVPVSPPSGTGTSDPGTPTGGGGGRPGAGNTGVPQGTNLTRHDGDLVITKAGAVYDALDIHGFVIVKAPDVTIRRSIIRGGPTSRNTGLVMVTDPNARNFILDSSELVPQFPSVHLNAVKGWNYTMRRVNAHGTVDIAEIYGDNVRIENSWLHDNTPYANDPNQRGGPSHDDGVQVESGHHIAIVGNTITGAHNASLMVTQDVGEVGDLVFNGNWVDGGACAVNANAKPLPSMSGLTINGNRFGRNTRIPDCSVLSSTTTTIVAEGNVWDDNGLAVRIRRNG